MKYKLTREKDVLGEWVSEDKEVKMKIYRDPDSKDFKGKIIWLLEDESNPDGPVLDTRNLDESLRQQSIVGIEFITGLSFNSRKKEWQNGEIYNPQDGKNYCLKSWLLDENTLNLRPSIDAMGLMGQNFKWFRVVS